MEEDNSINNNKQHEQDVDQQKINENLFGSVKQENQQQQQQQQMNNEEVDEEEQQENNQNKSILDKQEEENKFDQQQQEENQNNSINEVEQQQKEQQQQQFQFEEEKANQRKVVEQKNKIFEQAILERKKAMFERIKGWEDERMFVLNNHKNFIDNILISLDKKNGISQQSMQILIKFFTERIQQETEFGIFTQTKLPKLKDCYYEGENSKQQTYPILQKIFTEIDQLHQNKVKSIKEFCQFIEKQILKDLLFKENNEYNKKLSETKEKVIGLTKKLMKLKITVLQNYQKFNKIYFEQVQESQFSNNISEKKKMKNHKDLLNHLLEYMGEAQSEIALNRELGEAIGGYWEISYGLEVTRLETIDRALQFYLKKLQGTLVQQQEISIANKILECFKPVDEINKFYGVEQTLTAERVSMIKQQLNKVELGLLDVQNYLKNFKVSQIKINQLILKQLMVKRDVGGITKSYRDCLLLITIDKFMLLIDNPIDFKYQSADICLNLNFTILKRRKDELLIDIIEKIPGLMFNTTNKHLLKFDNTDEIEELKHYIDLTDVSKQ